MILIAPSTPGGTLSPINPQWHTLHIPLVPSTPRRPSPINPSQTDLQRRLCTLVLAEPRASLHVGSLLQQQPDDGGVTVDGGVGERSPVLSLGVRCGRGSVCG